MHSRDQPLRGPYSRAKVGDDGPEIVSQKDVSRFEITVHDALLSQVRHATSNAKQQNDQLGDFQRAEVSLENAFVEILQ